MGSVMLDSYLKHNHFRKSVREFPHQDPHLSSLAQLKLQYMPNWWGDLDFNTAGIYILTGGRQVGKSTSCKQLINDCLKKKRFLPERIFYLPCDEIYDAKELSNTLRNFIDEVAGHDFLLVIDEITYVKNWDRVIKALADEGCFKQAVCLLTGSDTVILKEAAMRFPGRRGKASKVDFHLYPLSFSEYVDLRSNKAEPTVKKLETLFSEYLLCGGYLRAINDLADHGEVTEATYLTYEQWIRGDFLRKGKSEQTLMAILSALLAVGVTQVSYSKLTQNIGLIVKETLMDYCRLLERMDVLITLQAFDQNKKQGFPKKDRKFHFTDPFIYRTILRWLQREGGLNGTMQDSTLVEAGVASHCHRLGNTFYFKGQGEIDVIWLRNRLVHALEVKWTQQLRSSDFKMLKHFKHARILTKGIQEGFVENVKCESVYQFLYQIEKL